MSNPRINSEILIQMAKDEIINPQQLIRDLVTYFSAAEITQFMEDCEYGNFEGESDEN